MATAHHFPASSISSSSSPTVSVWSRGHSTKSSASSMSFTSSPVQARDSLDLFGTQKRLEDVREEEDLPSRKMCSCKLGTLHSHQGTLLTTSPVDDYRCGDSSNSLADPTSVSPYPGYTLTDQDTNSTTSSGHQHNSKRQRSLDGPRRSVTQGFSSRFGSLSRRWRNRPGIAPPLSINTSTTPVTSPRSSMDTSVYYSRSASITSNAQDFYSPASMHSFMDEVIPESEVVPLYIDQSEMPQDNEEEQGQATTPLLPPTMLNLRRHDSPIQSPLQSPSIAPTNYCHTSAISYDGRNLSYLPSPPLSNQPSLTSMPRGRSNTATHDIPMLQQLSERLDPWTIKLGHADFSIHPEPYKPDYFDLDSFKEFRDNWTQARKQYTQHLARTIENYGETSKVYKLTEEKWSSIDKEWKNYDAQVSSALSPQLQRLSDGPATPDSPISLLERPVTRVTVPHMDKGGKFPEIGDTDIVGPLSIGVAKVPELQRGGTLTPPMSPRKRNLIKALGDIFRN